MISIREHKCKGLEEIIIQYRELYIVGHWEVDKRIWMLTDDVCKIPIEYCPFCGLKLL